MVSGLAVLANLLFCSLAAYPLARLRFAGRGLVLGLVVATILIPFQVVMIPLYLLMVQLGLRNTLLALVIPQAATAFGLYLLRQSFLGVPKELEEAARIDGCSRLGEWWNVMIPAAKADLITLAMFVFIGTWSDFLWPLVILDDPSLYTLPLGLQQLFEQLFAGLADRCRWLGGLNPAGVGLVRAVAALHPAQCQRGCGEGMKRPRCAWPRRYRCVPASHPSVG